jgi:ATP-dependent Lon protease
MRESAEIARSYVRAHRDDLGLDNRVDEARLHVHVPAGATPKDGPSAGVAMFVALSSLLTSRAVRSEVAMTGEISLRGLVLPIGGVKEKVLAALRAGITTVMLPARNRKELEEIPQEAREKLKLVWIESVDDALATALSETPAAAVPA